MQDAGGRRGFAALARIYAVAVRDIEGPGVAVGSVGRFVFGAIGTDIPDVNRVMAPDADALPDDDEIAAILDRLAAYRAMSWWIPPGPAAAELETRLARNGLAVNPADPEAPGMMVDLDGLPDPVSIHGLQIEVATNGDAAAEATLTSAAGFGMPPALADQMASIYRAVGEHRDGSSRYFLARLDGRPVGAALGTVDGDAVGIYNVGTIPAARGRGIGRAVMLAALLDGRRRGATIGVLEASVMGRPVYERLGFRDIGVSRVLVRRRP